MSILGLADWGCYRNVMVATAPNNIGQLTFFFRLKTTRTPSVETLILTLRFLTDFALNSY